MAHTTTGYYKIITGNGIFWYGWATSAADAWMRSRCRAVGYDKVEQMTFGPSIDPSIVL